MTNGTGVGGHIPAKYSFNVDINEYVSPLGLHPPNQNSDPRISLLAPGVNYVNVADYKPSGEVLELKKIALTKSKLASPKAGQLKRGLCLVNCLILLLYVLSQSRES